MKMHWIFAITGLPAIYSPCETQLLIDKGIVQLYEKTFCDVPDETTEKLYEERCNEQVKMCHEIYGEKKVEDARKYMERILSGKRKKAIKTGGDPNEITQEAVLDEARQRAINDVSNVFIQVPTQEPFDVGMLTNSSICSNNFDEIDQRFILPFPHL